MHMHMHIKTTKFYFILLWLRFFLHEITQSLALYQFLISTGDSDEINVNASLTTNGILSAGFSAENSVSKNK